MAVFFYLPTVLLSGFMFPIGNMPVIAQWLTYLNPLRYSLVIEPGIFLKGVGPGIVVPGVEKVAKEAGVISKASVTGKEKGS